MMKWLCTPVSVPRWMIVWFVLYLASRVIRTWIGWLS